MQENAEVRQVSLKQLASKNFILSLLLFVVLVAIIVVASLRDREGMSQLTTVYEEQFRVEQFKAKLSNIMLPLNDFSMSGDPENFTKIKKAVSEYKTSYDRIASIAYLTEKDKAALKQVHNLMTGVMDTANDVASEKIPANQAASVTLLAQNLVLAAHKKLESIVQGLEQQLQQKSAEREQKSKIQLYILLGFIALIIFLLELLNRKLLRQAQSLSKVSSSVAESAGDIIQVNKMQASATDQQSRFMEKVIKGLELIAESGKKISTTTASLEKNAGII
ncbi:MAG: methyl-accepting chemotaxis protein, partial [Mariprofundus sp.]